MNAGAVAITRANQQLGWLIALCSLIFLGARTPLAFSHNQMFPNWWVIGGSAAATGFVYLAIFTRWLPNPVLRALWTGIPSLVLILQFLSYLAYEGPESGVLPWVWSLEAAAVSLFALTPRPRYGFGFAVLSGFSVAISALIFTGSIPLIVQEATPPHVSNVAFVAIFLGIRNRCATLNEQELRARLAAEAAAKKEAETQRQAQLNRLIHDEVLSTLSAALLFTGPPPSVLQEEAARALAAFQRSDPDRNSTSIESNAALKQVFHQLYRVAPTAEFSLHGDNTSIPSFVLTQIILAMSECLRNAQKHSNASKIHVAVTIDASRISASVKDNGIGIDQATLTEATQTRMGIDQSVRGRITEINGTATILSAPGQGTEVLLAWPS